MLYDYKGEVLVYLHCFRQMRSSATSNHIKEGNATILLHCVISVRKTIT